MTSLHSYQTVPSSYTWEISAQRVLSTWLGRQPPRHSPQWPRQSTNAQSMFCKNMSFRVTKSISHDVSKYLTQKHLLTPHSWVQASLACWAHVTSGEIFAICSLPLQGKHLRIISLCMEKQELRSETLEDLSCLASNPQSQFTIRLVWSNNPWYHIHCAKHIQVSSLKQSEF